MGTKWQGYLLDFDWVKEMKKEKRALNTISHEEIIKHAIVGPIDLTANAHYYAQKVFFRKLQERGLPESCKIRHYRGFFHMKNRVDGRGKPKPNLKKAFEALKQYAES